MTDKEKLLLQMYSEQRKKKKIISIIIISIILVLSIAIGIIFVISSQSFKLAKDTVTVEYGEAYTPSIDDFVILNDKITKDNTSVEYEIVNEDGKKYASVGTYDVAIKHNVLYKFKDKILYCKTIKRDAQVIVQDTTAPTFRAECPAKLDIIRILDDKNKPDLSKYFVADDISGVCDISIKDSAVDYKRAGNYDIEVIAEDKYNNRTTMKCNLAIVEPQLSIVNKDITLKIGETAYIEISYLGDEKPKYISNDTSIVKVDEEGNITGVGAGNCYINVTCNGLTELCSVSIMANSEKKSSSTQPQSSSTSTNNKKKNNKNYSNKDFLFKDGYTMQNVTEAASSYLRASGKSGKCIPLKNDEGIYIGMRVIFD